MGGEENLEREGEGGDEEGAGEGRREDRRGEKIGRGKKFLPVVNGGRLVHYLFMSYFLFLRGLHSFIDVNILSEYTLHPMTIYTIFIAILKFSTILKHSFIKRRKLLPKEARSRYKNRDKYLLK